MSNNQISDIVQPATRKIIENTEAFIHSARRKALDSDTVSIMFNGEKSVLSKGDYEALKAENKAVMAEMKSKIKAAAAQLKKKSTDTTE